LEELRELAQKKPVDFDAYDSQYLAPYIAFINDEHTLRDAVAAQ